MALVGALLIIALVLGVLGMLALGGGDDDDDD